jgi:hypothetical protein
VGRQAGARCQGAGDRRRQEAGIPLADPRLDAPAGRGGLPDGSRPRVAVIPTGGGNVLIIPKPIPRALEARGGLRHRDLAGADGGRSGCPGELRRGRQHPSEKSTYNAGYTLTLLASAAMIGVKEKSSSKRSHAARDRIDTDRQAKSQVVPSWVHSPDAIGT